ncbi:MAG: hypothetical protein WA118_10345 [Carboxydocellales bacterium]
MKKYIIRMVKKLGKIKSQGYIMTVNPIVGKQQVTVQEAVFF